MISPTKTDDASFRSLGTFHGGSGRDNRTANDLARAVEMLPDPFTRPLATNLLQPHLDAKIYGTKSGERKIRAVFQAANDVSRQGFHNVDLQYFEGGTRSGRRKLNNIIDHLRNYPPKPDLDEPDAIEAEPGEFCPIFNSDWFSEYLSWEKVADTVSGWNPGAGNRVTEMCLRWVVFCASSTTVYGMKPGAATQLTEAEYIDLAAPYRGATLPCVIGLEFYGYRASFEIGSVGHRPVHGTTNHYLVWRQP